VDERLGVAPAYTAARAAEQPDGGAQLDERSALTTAILIACW
jgi:hypothetical protein